MRYAALAFIVLLTACDKAPAVTSKDLEKRDTIIAQLVDKNDALEKRVRSLEIDAELQSAISKANGQQSIAKDALDEKRAIVDGIVVDNRLRRLEATR